MEVISWKAASWLSWQPFEPCSLILLPPPSWTNAPRGPDHQCDLEEEAEPQKQKKKKGKENMESRNCEDEL